MVCCEVCVCMLCHFSHVQLCNPMDYSTPGSSVLGILWARMLEQVAVPSSRGSFWPRDEPVSLMPPALAGGFFTTSATGKPLWALYDICKSQVFDSSSVKDRRGITASFISSKGEQPKCPPTDDGINKMSSVCAMEYYSSLRRKLGHMLQHG